MTPPQPALPGGLSIRSKHFLESTILSIDPWVMNQFSGLWGPDARVSKLIGG